MNKNAHTVACWMVVETVLAIATTVQFIAAVGAPAKLRRR